MSEPSERDRELAERVVREVRVTCGPAEPPMMMLTTEPQLRAIALRIIAAAREEGRQEERARCAKIVCSNLAWYPVDRILAEIG